MGLLFNNSDSEQVNERVFNVIWLSDML